MLDLGLLKVLVFFLIVIRGAMLPEIDVDVVSENRALDRFHLKRVLVGQL